ncbi:MAG: VIT domain-containing protein [Planctomycetota bacterium]|jgi:Ca-activated chloride channel family protein
MQPFLWFTSRRRLLAILGTAALSGSAAGQDALPQHLGRASQVIIPQARAFALDTTDRGVEIESVQARVSILDGTATTTLDIALGNPSARRVEAVLLLPVPAGAVVSAFAFEGSASEPTAQVMVAVEARRLYDAIVAKVRDPALLEFAGYNLIRSSVFPVPPHGKQRVRLTYEHLLQRVGDRVDYVLPRSESLDLRCPWNIVVDLRSRGPISTVYSPSHEIVAERVNPNRFTVRLTDSAGLEPGPFRLSYLIQQGGVTASIFAYPDPKVASGGGGYFLLMAGLPASIDDAAIRIKREVTIVIDRSGSMAGEKMNQARAAALQVLEGLDDGEAFNIIDYSSSVSSFASRPVTKDSQTVAGARRYLASIRPAGGTNIHDALLEALNQPPAASMLPIVLFVTDGLPTIGRTREADIRDMVEQANVHKRRVFTFGVGHDVNVPLLDRIADRTRATATYVLPQEDVELKVARVFSRLYGPVFANPTLETLNPGGAVSTRLVRELIPDPLPDLFEGDQLILLGQYTGREPITLGLSGNFLGRQRTFKFTFGLDAATTRNAFVPRLWASRRIAYLVDQVRQAGADAEGPGGPGLPDERYRELVDEIVRLSTEFGILTEYTAFLATEGTNLADFHGLVTGCRNELERKAVQTRSGLGALNQGLNFNRQKGQAALNYRNRFVDERLNRVETTTVAQRCDLAFFRRGQRWIDSRLISVHQWMQPHQVLIIGSPEHTRLLRRLAGEGRQGVLSLSGEILLEVDGRAVLVKDGC